MKINHNHDFEDEEVTLFYDSKDDCPRCRMYMYAEELLIGAEVYLKSYGEEGAGKLQSVIDKIRGAKNEKLVCGRCYDEVKKLFPTNCSEKPERLAGQPLGQYHCPDCGAVILAGMKHPDLCKRCLDRNHPAFEDAKNE